MHSLVTHMPKSRDPRASIAVVIGQLSQGGSERQMYEFLAGCDQTRWAPTVYVSGASGYWEDRILGLKVPIVTLKGNRTAKMLQFRRACIERDTQCFFSWSSYTNGFAMALAGRSVRCLGSFRNALFADLPDRARWVWAWMSVAPLRTIVCNSRAAASEASRRCGTRTNVVYVPNAVALFPAEQLNEWRRQWRSRMGIDDKTLLIVGVGRLAPQKNYIRFVDVMRAIDGEFDAVSVIAGDDLGSGTSVCKHAAAYGLSEKVRLIGKVPDARELIAAADLFLLTSDFEGTPNVVLEAMAAGIACVATTVDGVKDIIEHEVTGLLAQRDAAALADNVRRLAAEPGLRRRLGRTARAKIEQGPRPEEVVQRLWALCEPGS